MSEQEIRKQLLLAGIVLYAVSTYGKDAATANELDHANQWTEKIEQIGSLGIQKVVKMRMLVNPLTQQPVFSWRYIATTLGISHPVAETRFNKGLSALAVL